MKEIINLLSAECRGKNGGAVLSQQAMLKQYELPLQFCIICRNHGEADTAFVKEAGAWFQNIVVNRVLNAVKAGKDLEGEMSSLFAEKCLDRKLEYAALLCVGNTIAYRVESEQVFIKILVNQFGKNVFTDIRLLFGDYPENIGVIEVEGQTMIFMHQMDFVCESSKTKDVVSCIEQANSTPRLSKALGEVASELGVLESLVCVRCL